MERLKSKKLRLVRGEKYKGVVIGLGHWFSRTIHDKTLSRKGKRLGRNVIKDEMENVCPSTLKWWGGGEFERDTVKRGEKE